MRCGVILAAGKQTRFFSDLPKSLMVLKDNITIIDHNVEILKDNVDKIFVIIERGNTDLFFKTVKNKTSVQFIEIDSGFGCGDAVLKVLSLLTKWYPIFKDCILIWGDSIQNKKLFKDLIKEYNDIFTMPVCKEKNPYVHFQFNSEKIEKVVFTKYDNIYIDEGYHDQSIFMFDIMTIANKLNILKEIVWNIAARTTRNGELLFLDIFNYEKVNDIKAKVFVSKNQSLAFNTYEEYEKIKESIK